MTRRSGFSLLEVMCAILVLGIGVAGLTQGITTALGSSKESELQTSAALAAAGRIELLRAAGSFEAGEKEGECGKGMEIYRWKQAINRSNIDGLFDVQVDIIHARTGKLIYSLQTLLFYPPSESTNTRDSNSTRSQKNRKRTP